MREQPPPILLAGRGCFLILGVLVALVVALVTPLGGAVDNLQAEAFGGTYAPKLTMLLIVVGVLAAGAVIYVPFERLVLRRWAKTPPSD